MTAPNETNPSTIMALAAKCIAALEESEASPGEKIAALKSAAFVVEQAMTAQNLATVLANIMAQNRPK